MEEKDLYKAQKEYIKNKRKKVGVSVDAEKYDAFKAKAAENGDTIYSLINNFIDEYLNK